MKWEYLTFYLGELNDPNQDDRLNNLGSLGWELVTIMVIMNVGCIAYFKRPLRTKLEAEILGEFAIPYGEDRSSLT